MRTIIYALFGYFFLLLTIRVLTRRPGAQLTPFEFVLVFLVGGVAILATVGDDRSMTNCFGAVITVGLMHRLVSLARQHSSKFGAIVDGTPVLLMQNGRWQTDLMARMKVQPEDVMASARAKGIRTLDQIKYAVLERNGAISIIKSE